MASLDSIAPISRSKSDEELMTELRGGSMSALEQVYDRYSSLVYTAALVLLRERSAAEDVVQDVFLNLWRTRESMNGDRGSLAGFLTVCSRHRAIDLLRQQRSSDMDVLMRLSVDGSQAKAAEQAQALENVSSVLSALSKEERELFNLAYLHGLSHTEISTRTGLPLGTVKSRLRMTMLYLRKKLGRLAA